MKDAMRAYRPLVWCWTKVPQADGPGEVDSPIRHRAPAGCVQKVQLRLPAHLARRLEMQVLPLFPYRPHERLCHYRLSGEAARSHAL